MPEETHTFRLHSAWTGNSDGDGVLTAEGRMLAYGRPPELGGAPGRTSPEEMLLGAVAACYSITLAFLAERKRLPVTRLELDCTGDVVRQLGGTLKYVSIRLAPRITLQGADDAQRASALDAAHKAEQYCVISNAIRGNVAITVEPQITVE